MKGPRTDTSPKYDNWHTDNWHTAILIKYPSNFLFLLQHAVWSLFLYQHVLLVYVVLIS